MAPTLKKIVTSNFKVKNKGSYVPIHHYTAPHPKRLQFLHFPKLLRSITYWPCKVSTVMFSDVFQIITFLQYAYIICTLMMCQMQWAPYKDVGWPTSHDAWPHNIWCLSL